MYIESAALDAAIRSGISRSALASQLDGPSISAQG